jgi:hypothetical protein
MPEYVVPAGPRKHPQSKRPIQQIVCETWQDARNLSVRYMGLGYRRIVCADGFFMCNRHDAVEIRPK